jgi:hypothetical protein
VEAKTLLDQANKEDGKEEEWWYTIYKN